MDREKTSLFHPTKASVTLGVAGLVVFAALTYLLLINTIDRNSWSGLGLLDLIIITTLQIIVRRKKPSTQ